jgi:hypothetical protein
VSTEVMRTVADYGAELPPFYSIWAWGLQLSRAPDGDSLAVGTVNEQADIWMLDGFEQPMPWLRRVVRR